jgi:hypothetical protein
MLALTDRYTDRSPGLADVSIVALAHRFQTRCILTFDQRRFPTMTPLTGGSFELLPGDEPPQALWFSWPAPTATVRPSLRQTAR